METFDGKLAETSDGLTYAMSVSEFLATPFNELAKIALPPHPAPVGTIQGMQGGSGETNRTTDGVQPSSGIGSPTTCEDE